MLVQYWATWCEPCKADMPLLKELRAKFKDNFEVIGVCLDNDKRDMLAFLKENDPRWPQLYRRRRAWRAGSPWRWASRPCPRCS